MDPDPVTTLPTSISKTDAADISETATNLPNILASAPVVEVNKIDGEKLRIHVVCEKRPGLVQNLVGSLERVAGLLLLQAEISAHNHVDLDAIGVQETGDAMDTVSLENLLLNIIRNTDQPSIDITSATSRECI